MQLKDAPRILKKYRRGSVHDKGTVTGSSFYGQVRGGYGLLVTFVKDGKETTYTHNV